MKRHPEPHQVVAAAYLAAQAASVDVNAVLGLRGSGPVRAARRDAYRRLRSMGFSINGIATAWGCDRRVIQRVCGSGVNLPCEA